MATPGGPNDRRTAVAVVALVAVAAVAAAAALLLADGGEEVTIEEPPQATSSSTAPSTTTSVAPPTSVSLPERVDASTAVFPRSDTSRSFDDPVAAARAFAVDFVGFTDPVVGPFRAGDARSGEVDIKPTDTGPTTTVLVRQLGPDATWWVLGATTANIDVDEPAAGDQITSPLATRGRALAFEGTVEVEVREDGGDEPLGAGFVTGSGGGEPGPFEGEIAFAEPSAPFGSVVFLTRSAENGQVWEATVVRVRFPAG